MSFSATKGSTLFDYHQLGPNKNKSRRESVKSDYKRRERMIVDESAREFQAKREPEVELSSTLILVWPGLNKILSKTDMY